MSNIKETKESLKEKGKEKLETTENLIKETIEHGEKVAKEKVIQAKSNFFNHDVLLGTVLFGLLTPGVILTIPPTNKGIFMTGETNKLAPFVHTVVFAATFGLIRSWINSK